MELSRFARAGVFAGIPAGCAGAEAATGAGAGAVTGAGAGVGRGGGGGGEARAAVGAVAAGVGAGAGLMSIATGPVALALALEAGVGLLGALVIARAALGVGSLMLMVFTAARDLVLMRRLFMRTEPRRAGAAEAVGPAPPALTTEVSVLSGSLGSGSMSAAAATSCEHGNAT